MFDLQLFDFAVFNVADIYVTVAMFLILIYAFFIDPKIEKKLKAEKEAEVKKKKKIGYRGSERRNMAES